MLTYDTIKKLCKGHGITVTGLEKELGFARGSLCKVDTNKPSMEKVQKIADYFNMSVSRLVEDSDEEGGETYYLNDETAKMAQAIFENKELRALFDTARDASPEDLETAHNMLLALKRKENGNID